MNDIQISDLAKRFARLSYRIQIEADECGGEPCFVARHPELRGCMADGRTEEEAIINLNQVREEFIQVLLDADAEIPVPAPQVSVIGLMPSSPPGSSPTIFVTPRNIKVPDSTSEELLAAPFSYEEVA